MKLLLSFLFCFALVCVFSSVGHSADVTNKAVSVEVVKATVPSFEAVTTAYFTNIFSPNLLTDSPDIIITKKICKVKTKKEHKKLYGIKSEFKLLIFKPLLHVYKWREIINPIENRVYVASDVGKYNYQRNYHNLNR